MSRDPFDLIGRPDNILTRERRRARVLETTTRRNVRADSLVKFAADMGEVDFRAVDDEGRLRTIMSAVDLFEEFGIHAHLAGFNENGTPQIWFSADDGSEVFGGGAGKLSKDGIEIVNGGDALKFYGHLTRAILSMSNQVFRILYVLLLSDSNEISNGDFETGDLTDWTETDPGGKISIDTDDEQGSFVKFAIGATTSEYIQQNLSTAAPKILVSFKAKTTDVITGTYMNISTDATGLAMLIVPGEWSNYSVLLDSLSNSTYIKIVPTATLDDDVFIDDIVVQRVSSSSMATFDNDEIELDGDVKVTGDLTVLGNGNGLWRTIVKTVYEPRQSTTTPVTDGELSVDVPPLQTYAIRGRIWYTTPAAADFKFRFLCGSASPAMIRWAYRAPGTTTLVQGDTFANTNITSAVTDPGYIEFEALVTADAGGDSFVFQWAQVTSTASETNVLFGSYFDWLPV